MAADRPKQYCPHRDGHATPLGIFVSDFTQRSGCVNTPRTPLTWPRGGFRLITTGCASSVGHPFPYASGIPERSELIFPGCRALIVNAHNTHEYGNGYAGEFGNDYADKITNSAGGI